VRAQRPPRLPPSATLHRWRCSNSAYTHRCTLRKCLAKLFRREPHSQKKENYEGVLLEEILRKAGFQRRASSAQAMATYVVAEPPTATTFFSRLPNSIREFSIATSSSRTPGWCTSSRKRRSLSRLSHPREKRPARWSYARIPSTLSALQSKTIAEPLARQVEELKP